MNINITCIKGVAHRINYQMLNTVHNFLVTILIFFFKKIQAVWSTRLCHKLFALISIRGCKIIFQGNSLGTIG